MVRSKSALLVAILSSLVCFLSIGYAAVADMLLVSGNVTYEPQIPEGVYISKAELYSASNVTSIEIEYFNPTNLRTEVMATGQNASVIYKITVANASALTYRFDSILFDANLDSNSYIDAGVSIATLDTPDGSLPFDTRDTVSPHGERVFYAEYSINSSASNILLTLTVNYNFIVTMESIHNSLLDALNTPTDYAKIVSAFDQKYAETGETVIGNTGDASSADAQLIRQIFGENPTVNIDGVDTPVKIMIRREDVDGSSSTGDGYGDGPPGCEYTVYLTTDALDENGQATVYAISHSRNEDGSWYQLGQLYEGTATVIDGSVDYDSWRATENTYYIGNISYKVGVAQHGNGINDIKTLEQLMQIDFNFDRETGNAIRSGLLSNVRAIIYGNNVDKTTEEYLMLRQAFEEAECCYILQNNGNGIDLNWGISRAEAVPHLIKLWEAYDNYRALHP